MIAPRVELGTFRVSDGCSNQAELRDLISVNFCGFIKLFFLRAIAKASR